MVGRLLLVAMLLLGGIRVSAQTDGSYLALGEEMPLALDMPVSAAPDTLLSAADSMALVKIAGKAIKKKRDWTTWHPESKRALWLAIVLPGAGQIYNRKYWKLPIVYGGFVGCIYAWRWNGQMYHDYSQAYMDLMDNDANTHSYDQFMHLGQQITQENAQKYQEIFRKRKDRYRRWRDMSVFATIAVYALSIVDAYVDASLSEFDISNDLSMRVAPTVINNKMPHNPLQANALGLQCSINF